ncbi:hypothetical protein E2C01_015239 [Portunus trituberculatus]|uniref:Uncharacterized protein n=1 Tax=Portunus trituberculatus TaxID=210409 RepID=A0A5B7DMA4_PORTR|nr:hypothetical protein [Portunus trituberculatus]
MCVTLVVMADTTWECRWRVLALWNRRAVIQLCGRMQSLTSIADCQQLVGLKIEKKKNEEYSAIDCDYQHAIESNVSFAAHAEDLSSCLSRCFEERQVYEC